MDSSVSVPEDTVVPAAELLDGEDPNSVHLDDPEHWVAVYSELLRSTNRILEALRERLASPAAADPEDVKLAQREMSALQAHCNFFTSRLRWWANRGRELWS